MVVALEFVGLSISPAENLLGSLIGKFILGPV